MQIMQHPVFRQFWYPTLAATDLQSGPKPFTLLGENIVLWRQGDGTPAALEDRCPHRRARLSVDSYVVDGALQCGYHGAGAGRQARRETLSMQGALRLRLGLPRGGAAARHSAYPAQ
jgi:phenylpropionate dioxygenase-like ring-hydroxylating dioxygenase large terminal subunit